MKNKWLLLVLAIAVFAAFLVFFQSKKSTHIPKLNEATSWNDVKNYQYSYVPGLERAEKLGLTKNVNQSIAIPGSNKKIEINEIWYNKKHIIFLYSIPFDKIAQQQYLLKHNVSQTTPPRLNFQITPDKKQDSAPSIRFSTYPGNSGGGIYYQGRLYLKTIGMPLMDAQNHLMKVKRIQLNQIELVQNGHIERKSTPISISVKQDFGDHFVTRALNVPINVGNSHITLTKIQIGTLENKLYIHYRPEYGQSAYFLGQIKSNGTSASFTDFTKVGTDEYILHTSPLNKIPKKLVFNLNSIVFQTDTHFSFSVNVTHYKNKFNNKPNARPNKVKLDKHLTTLKNTDIQLQDLQFTDRVMNVDIIFKIHDVNNPLTIFPSNIHIINEKRDTNHSPSVVVTNEHGDLIANNQGGFGGTLKQGYLCQFGVDKATLLNTKTIHVAFKNIMIKKAIQLSKNINIPIK